MSEGHVAARRDDKGADRLGVLSGGAAVGMAMDDYEPQRRIAMMTVAGFSGAVTLLTLLSAPLLTWGPLRALASAAELAEARGRVAELETRFVTTASHEFRTPLAVILAVADAVRRYSSRMTLKQQEERLLKIQRAVRQMTDLLEDVLTEGRADAGKLQCTPAAVDIELLAREVIADVQGPSPEGHEVRLRTNCVPDAELILDRKLVRQILWNLLTNAIKYSPAGGVVDLEVERRNGRVRLRVSDRGIGIPPEDQPHLFEPFHRAGNVGKIGGTGLGLAITKRAVVSHGGTIRVDSVVGQGTKFTVELPCSPPPAQAQPQCQ